MSSVDSRMFPFLEISGILGTLETSFEIFPECSLVVEMSGGAASSVWWGPPGEAQVRIRVSRIFSSLITSLEQPWAPPLCTHRSSLVLLKLGSGARESSQLINCLTSVYDGPSPISGVGIHACTSRAVVPKAHLSVSLFYWASFRTVKTWFQKIC